MSAPGSAGRRPVWSDPVLDALRLAADPVADALVAGAEVRGELPALYAWVGDRGPAPPALVEWLDRTRALPGDPARIRRGQQVYGRHAVQAMVGLLCKGLPEAYAAPRGAAILLVAGRFAREPRVRLMETARFFAAVMEPGALDGPGAPGVAEVQKVRLVHALARRHIARDPSYRPEDGAPINQEDMLGTLMSFSILVLDAFPRLGVRLSVEEEADYLHVWQVVGRLLGIAPDWIPHDPEDARLFFRHIRRRHHGESEAGRVLTAALLDALRGLLPGVLADQPVALVWHLCEPSVARHLGLPEPARPSRTVAALQALGRLVDAGDEMPLIADLIERLGRAVYEAVYRLGSEGHRPTYVAPGQG